jgi:hypothetical protein
MNTDRSVYPKVLADKCVELLCARQPRLQHHRACLAAARDLMMHGCVQPHDRTRWKGTRFAVLSPQTAHYYDAVDLHAETCTYADFLRTQRPCSHICAVVLTLIARRLARNSQIRPLKARAR